MNVSQNLQDAIATSLFALHPKNAEALCQIVKERMQRLAAGEVAAALKVNGRGQRTSGPRDAVIAILTRHKQDWLYRQDIAERIGIEPHYVSHIAMTLLQNGKIEHRRGERRQVRYRWIGD